MGRPWQDKVSKEYDLAIVIGRFQPLHYGHVYNIDKGTTLAKKVLVLVGSAFNSISPKNPFTYEEREKMVLDHYKNSPNRDNVFVEPLADNTYEENQWVTDVQDVVKHYASGKIVIIGHEKDSSSYYLKCFPQWSFSETGQWPAFKEAKVVSATQIRELLFEETLLYLVGVMPSSTYAFIEQFSKTEAFTKLKEEKKFLDKYKASWANSPFPPTFATVDAVVVQSGHILLVRRKVQPGQDLWAMPGGFLNPEETQEAGVIRELREETKLKVPVPVLRGSIVKDKTFSKPTRSQRGRTITQAYLFQLKNDEDLPKVKGSDDAKEAKWVALSDFYDMETVMYEDHYYIIRKMLDNE